jgi:hypothetical protein
MRAELKKEQSSAENYSNQKELVRAYSVVGINDKGELSEGVTCRVWMGRSSGASVVYASVWTHGKAYTSGTGKAGGGGYDKVSAAVGDALESAGIKLDEDINGRGDRATRDALIAVARDIMDLDKCIFVSHG